MTLSEAIHQQYLISLKNVKRGELPPFIHSKSIERACQEGKVALPEALMKRCSEIAHVAAFPSIENNRGTLVQNIELLASSSSELLGSGKINLSQEANAALFESFRDWRLFPFSTSLAEAQNSEEMAANINILYAS